MFKVVGLDRSEVKPVQ